MKRTHPNEIYDQLRQGRTSPVFLRNLQCVHEVCRDVSASPQKDYSLAAIGRMSEARGGPKLNTFYSPKGEHFRVLVKAWRAWDGMEPRPAKPPDAAASESNELLKRIENIAVRAYVGEALAELRRLRNEVRTLRTMSSGVPVIDMRPSRLKAGTIVVTPATQLLPDERQTLLNSIDPEWLRSKGFQEGSRGELIDAQGRVILARGALPGIRKLLGEYGPKAVGITDST